MSNDKLYESVGNYTKYKLVEMLIDKYKDKQMDNLNQIEQLADDVMNVLSVCGMKYYQELKGKVPIIGVGGIDSGQSAFEKIAAGASAVQLYTGMIYKGPTIVKEIKKGLVDILKEKGFKNIIEAVGSYSN